MFNCGLYKFRVFLLLLLKTLSKLAVMDFLTLESVKSTE